MLSALTAVTELDNVGLAGTVIGMVLGVLSIVTVKYSDSPGTTFEAFDGLSDAFSLLASLPSLETNPDATLFNVSLA